MKQSQALEVLHRWDQRGRQVFTQADLARLFDGESPKTLQISIDRLVHRGLLIRACRGVYVFAYGQIRGGEILEQVARAIRRGHYNYVSLESALSEYGAISQIPIDRLTVMTTGRKGTYRTPWGVIEFTHTARPVRELIGRMRDVGRPLRLATPQSAWADLKRVGRNTHLVDEETLGDVQAS
jgi:hypothetical protein